MIELLPGLPAQTVGFAATGQVTASDYESIVIPAIESKLKEHGKVRVLYQIGPSFSGFSAKAMVDDAKLGIKHLKEWEKIAIVTDNKLVAGAISIFRFAIPCPVNIFTNSQYAEAVNWIAA